MVKKSKSRRQHLKNVPSAVAHISSTFNNTMISISDMQGHVFAWSSAGLMKFSGAKKSTAFAAQVAASDVAKKARDHGVKTLEVFVKGPGSGKESAIRALHSEGFSITLIRDVTPIPHNGTRPPKRRRV